MIDDGVGGLRVVISDVGSCQALERARDASIPTVVVPYEGDRDQFTAEICDRAESYGAKALVMAGFMRILGPVAMARFPNSILNIHPSLLPAFPGVDAVRQALRAGVKLSGVTVHFVDEKVDHGPIIAQRAVPVLPGDDEQSLHVRIQKEEHALYPRVVRAFLDGLVMLENGIVIWS